MAKSDLIACADCGSNDVKIEQKEGRGLPPKGYKRKPGDRRLISWAGLWNMYTCNSCGNEWKKLIG